MYITTLFICTAIWHISKYGILSSPLYTPRESSSERMSLITRDAHTLRNQLRFPYGVNFKYNGELTHNLDRVWIVTKFPLPRFEHKRELQIPELEPICTAIRNNITYAKEVTKCEHCQRIMSIMLDHCMSASWRFEHLKSKGRIIIKETEGQIEDLKRALPELYDNGLQPASLIRAELANLAQPQPQDASSPSRVKRHKRGIFTAIASTLIPIATEAVTWLIRRKRDKAVNKAIERLDSNNRLARNQLHNLASDFVMYGKYDLETEQGILAQIGLIDNDLKAFQQGTVEFIRNITVKSRSTTSVDELRNILFTRVQIDKFLMGANEAIMMEERLANSLKDMVEGVATLAQGRLSPKILDHSTLNGMIETVKHTLRVNKSAHVVALDRVNKYYDMKLATFMADAANHELTIIFPVLIKPKNLAPMALYEIETVHVPIKDENEQANSYTRVAPHKPYIAVNENHYIQLQIPELRMCKVIDTQYFCEETFLVKHRSKHTCEAALLYELSDDLIKHHCTIEYYFNKTVVPSVLDGGDEIVLANFRSQKEISCVSENNFDKPLALPEEDYAKVNRSILCGCRIKGDLIEVMSSISACSEVRTRPALQFTVNKAFNLYLRDLEQQKEMLATPPMINLTNLEIPGPPAILRIPEKLPLSLQPTNWEGKSPKTLKELAAMLKEKAKILNQTLQEPNLPNYTQVELPKHVSFLPVLLSAIVMAIIITIICICVKHYKLKTLAYASIASVLPNQASASAISTALTDEENHNMANMIMGFIQIVFVLFMLWRMVRKSSFLKGFFRSERITLHFQLDSGERTTSLKIKTLTGFLNQYIATGEIIPTNISLEKQWTHDVIHINYGEYSMHYLHLGNKLALPSRIYVPFTKKMRVRHILNQPHCRGYMMLKSGRGWLSPHMDYSEVHESGSTAMGSYLAPPPQLRFDDETP